MNWGLEDILDTHLSNGWVYDEQRIAKWFKVQSDLMWLLHRSFQDHDGVIVTSHAFIEISQQYKALLNSHSAPFGTGKLVDAEHPSQTCTLTGDRINL